VQIVQFGVAQAVRRLVPDQATQHDPGAILAPAGGGLCVPRSLRLAAQGWSGYRLQVMAEAVAAAKADQEGESRSA
jgi:hypothetical protein